ncbi:hypothetical protein B566_EDAN011958 [Ephemera danica]|nr:hypothetical protein B566_EDAN011958 [Ephemera danica]
MSYNNNTLPRSNKVQNNSGETRTRPVSLYDNLQQQQPQEVQPISDPLNAPSQALCLSTTVPVNIARSSIAGRHTPTRASVRHSRMLVLSQQTGRVPWKYLPPVVRWHRLASFLMLLLVLSGAAALVMAFYLTMFAPFLAIHDLPFWSGALNLMAGVAGLTLACWCRRLHPGVVAPSWVCVATQPYIALCIGVLVLATAASVCSIVFSIIRLIWLFQVECLARMLSHHPHAAMLIKAENTSAPHGASSCVCNTTNGELYEGLACDRARFDLMAVMAGSGVIHAVAVCLALGYLLIHWRSRRYGQPLHTDLRRTTPPSLVATAL